MTKGKKLLTFCLLTISLLTANAYDFAVKNSDGKVIYYNLVSTKDKTVEVTYRDKNYNCYSGEIVIPAFVEYNDVVYTVVGLGGKSMRDCPELETLKLPETVEYVKYKAIHGNENLKELILPSSLKRVDYGAINYLRNLKHLYISNPNPSDIDFVDKEFIINPSCIIGVPKGSAVKYQSLPFWNKYTIEEHLIL